MEHELQGHAKKVYKVWKNPAMHTTEKIKDIGIEIAIIVFAISLSLWFHNWSEHRHEQKEVKKFLLGLKEDIKGDIEQSKFCVSYYHKRDSFFAGLFSNVDSMDILAKKDSDVLYNEIFSNVWLRENNNRYQSFKSSGKIGRIENDSLSLQIFFYYQEALDQLKSSETGWLSTQKNLRELWEDNIVINKDGSDNSVAILKLPKAKYLCKMLIPYSQMYTRYDQLIKTGESIIAQIDETYK
jgi:hypothetical protein